MKSPSQEFSKIGATLIATIIISLYKVFFNNEYDTSYILVVAIITYLSYLSVNTHFNMMINYSLNDKDKLKKIGLKFTRAGAILTFFGGPLSFYLFFYKGLYGLYKSFSPEINIKLIIFRICIVVMSYMMIMGMASFTPKTKRQFLEELDKI